MAAAAPASKDDEYTYKILIMGAAGSGKTSVCRRYCYAHNEFSAAYKPTIGADHFVKTINTRDIQTLLGTLLPRTLLPGAARSYPPHIRMPVPSDGHVGLSPRMIKLQLWDLSGHDRFVNLIRNYYRATSAAVIVFDQTSPQSFAQSLNWKSDLETKLGKVPIIVMQNKCDLPKHADIPDHEAMDAWVASSGVIGCVQTTAKDLSHPGVEHAIALLLHSIIANELRQPEAEAKSETRAAQQAAAPEVLRLEAKQPSKNCC